MFPYPRSRSAGIPVRFSPENPQALKAGDILLIGDAFDDGIVSDFQKLVSFDKNDGTAAAIAKTAGADYDDEIFSGFGTLTDHTRNIFKVNAEIRNDYDSSIEVPFGDSDRILRNDRGNGRWRSGSRAPFGL